MIKGIDIGNFSTKDEKGYIFESKVSSLSNILGSTFNLTLNGESYVVGEGSFDTEFKKVEKKSYIKLLFGILAVSGATRNVQLMLGLPLSQYREDKNKLKELLKSNFMLDGSLNGIAKTFIIEDVEVYPEGIASLPVDYEGILVDIGGLTTDCCMVTNINNRRKIEKTISLCKGTLNLYSDFINILNSKFSLDLKSKDADRIIKHGLLLNGERENISFAINIFKDYLEELIRDLNLHYSLKTNDITFTGGGSLLLKKPILNRISYAIVQDNPVFSNAIGFYREGLRIWQD